MMEKAPKRVLLIDDDQDFVFSTKTFLEGRGYFVDTASNGQEGWEKLTTYQNDLVVLDIMMDYEAEGFNLAYKLRKEEKFKGLPVIIVSGFTHHLNEKMDKFEFVMGRDWPADAFMEKPINLKSLADKIETFLKKDENKG
jgi:DNA-binding response OmpR family regulator